MKNNMCPTCFGTGWVCENHPSLPWDDDLGCTCGAGVPCECNKAGEFGVDEPRITHIMEEMWTTKH